MNEAFSEYESAKSEVESINSQIDDTQSKIDQLNAKGGLTLVEKGELNELRELNAELQRSLDLAKKEEAIKARAAAESALEAYNKNFKYDISEESTNRYSNAKAPSMLDYLQYGSDAAYMYGAAMDKFVLETGDEKNISSQLSDIEKYKALRDAVPDSGSKEWLEYNKEVQNATDSVWEQVSALQDYKTKLEAIPAAQRTVAENEAIAAIGEDIDYIYQKLDPETWQSWKMEDLFGDNKFMSNAKQDLIDMAKEAGNLDSVTKALDVGGQFAYIAKSIEAAGLDLDAFISSIGSAAGLVNHDNIKAQLRRGFLEGGDTRDTGIAVGKRELEDWVETLSEEELELAYQISLDTETATWRLKDWQNALESYKANYSDLGITIAGEQDTASRVAAVRSEAFSPTGLSSESISAVESVFGDMEGYDYDKMFINSANGVQLNVDAFNDLQKQYERTKKAKIDDHIKDLRKQLTEATKAAGKAEDAEKARANANVDAIRKQLQNAEELRSMYHGLTSAYNEYLQSLQTTNASDQFDTISDGYKKAEEALKAGRIGDDDFLSYMSLLTGKDYDFKGGPQEAAAAFEGLNQKIIGTNVSMKDLLQGGQKGAENFVQALRESGNGWVELKDDGSMDFNFDAKEVAEEWGTTEEFIDMATRALKTYGLYVEENDFEVVSEEEIEKAKRLAEALSAVSEKVEESKTSAPDANDKLKELGYTDYTFNFGSTDIDNVTSEIEKAKGILSDFYDGSDGTIDMTIDGAEEALAILTALISRRQELENKEITLMNVDATKVEGQIGEVITAFQEAKTLFDSREHNVTIGADTSEIDASIIDIVSKLGDVPDEISTKLKIDSEELETNLAIVNSTDEDVTIEAKIKAANEIQSLFAGVTPELLVSVGVSPESIANIGLDAATGTINYELGEVAKPSGEDAIAAGIINYEVGNVAKPIDVVATGTINYKVGAVDKPAGASGTATPSGSTFAQGTAFVRGDWGVKGSGVALGGKLLPHYLEIS